MLLDRLHTLVVGGGQAGLATGFHLRRSGIEHVIVDEHAEVGAAWRDRWDSLRLFTPRRYSGLPGMPFPGPPWSLPTKDDVADYLAEYAAAFDLDVCGGVVVRSVTHSGDRFVVNTSAGLLTADNVVVATGPFRHPRIPELAIGVDAEIVQLHSSAYRRPSQFVDGDVLVVGAGSSGAEIALELSTRHRVYLSGPEPGQEPVQPGTSRARFVTPLMWFVGNHVVQVGNPLGRRVRDRFLRPPRGIPRARVRPRDLRSAGVERVGRTIAAVGGRPQLDDGRVLEVANIVWCTGYTTDYGWIDLPIFDEFGYPDHDRGVVRSQPGLYFAGLLFQRSLASSLVGGVGRDAEHVARSIADRR